MNKWDELNFNEQVELYNQEIWFVVSVWSEYTQCIHDASETDDIYANITGLSIDEALERLEQIYGLSKSEINDYPGEDDDCAISYYFHNDREYVITHGSGSEMELIIDGDVKYI